MKTHFCANFFIAIALLLSLSACGTKFGRNFEKQVAAAKTGILDTETNIEKGLKQSCDEAPKVSATADEVLNLVSSEDQTQFTVDSKMMGKAKQLTVCVDSKLEHTVIAKPDNCEEKMDKIKPPFDIPSLEFRFMLAECQVQASNASLSKTPTNQKSKSLRSKHKKRLR